MVPGDRLMTCLAGCVMSAEGLRERKKEERDDEEEGGCERGMGRH